MTRNFVVSLFAAFAFSLTTLAQGVDPLTGRASISIPLGGIGVQDVSVSASLAHHGGALKVNEGPGNAGMGWQIYVGGSVSREVRGLPDDYEKVNDTRRGWLQLINANATNNNATVIQNFTSTSDDDLSVCSDEAADWSFINSLGYNYDTEPDVFYFSAPGLSGKFVFGADGNPKLIPYQDVSITVNKNSNTITGFVITTPQGMVYTFSAIAAMERKSYGVTNSTKNQLYQQALAFNSAWNITSILSKSTGIVANYTYQTFPKKSHTNYIAIADPSHTNVAVDTVHKIKDTLIPIRPTLITIKNYSMSLGWSNDLIDKITISESESGSAKQFDFTYRTVISTGDNLSIKVAKPFLAEVKQQNPITCEAFPSYQFEYAYVDLALGQAAITWPTGKGEDYFGYYNGTSNYNVPVLYYYNGEAGPKRFRLSQMVGYTGTVYNTTNGTNMAVNPTYAKFGAITKITYPTGGRTTYTYEGNTYFDATTNEELAGPGVRVASVTSSGGEIAYGKTNAPTGYHDATVNYQYTQDGSSVTSGKITYPPIYGYTDGSQVYRTQSGWTEPIEVMYGRVKEFTVGQGFREYIYSLPNMYPDANATKSKVARQSGNSCATTYLKNGTYNYPFAPLKDINYLRGVPISITEYDQSSPAKMLSQKTMTYTTGNTTPGNVKGLRFEWAQSGVFIFSQYDIPVNDAQVLNQVVTKVYSEKNTSEFTTSTTSYVYNSRNWVKQTTTTSADEAVSKQYVKYALDFPITAPSGTDQQAVAINKLNTGNREGEVIETWSTFTPAGGTEALSGAQLTLYKDYGTYVAPYQSLSFVQGGGTGTAPTTTYSTTNFTKDASYIVQGPILELSNTLVVSQIDPLTLTTTGTHYATGTSSPLATFANCKAEHAIYEGFEFISTRGLVYSGTGATIQTTASAGKKSLQIASTNATVTSAANMTKKENSYRISGWIHAAQNTTLTIQAKNGATIQGTATLVYTTPNTWKYIETFMDMTNVSASFSLHLTANATMKLDDFVAMPKSARVSYGSSTPYIGATEQIGDRGLKTKVEYDGLGRPVRQYDQANNLREVREYGGQRSGKVELSAHFGSNVTQYVPGQTINFTAAQQPACITPVVYNWEIQGLTTSTYTGSSINHTFNTFGSHTVKLTTCTPICGGGATQTTTFLEDICVSLPDALAVTLSVGPTNSIYKCDQVNPSYRTFTASVSPLNTSLASGIIYLYEWYAKGPSGVWQLVGATNTNQLQYNNPPNAYEMTCVLTMSGLSRNIPDSSCGDKVSIAATSSINITYIDNSPCQ